jgi:hypothetical protein
MARAAAATASAEPARLMPAVSSRAGRRRARTRSELCQDRRQPALQTVPSAGGVPSSR